jgi:hypothetical protein
MDIQKDAVVLIKARVFGVKKDSVLVQSVDGLMPYYTFFRKDVHSVLEQPPETKDQKIARLEARVKELEGNIMLPNSSMLPHSVDVSNIFKPSGKLVDNETPWYPEQLEGYGPWINISDISPETNLYGYARKIGPQGQLFVCKKLP